MAKPKPIEREKVEDDWGFLPENPGPISLEKKPRELNPDKLDRLRDIESGLLERSMAILGDALSFRDIEPGSETCPPEWRDMDPDEAVKRLRVANAAWLGKKDAPVGLDLAKQVAVGIIKARATEKTAPKTLNVTVVNMSAPLPVFDVIEVESKDDR